MQSEFGDQSLIQSPGRLKSDTYVCEGQNGTEISRKSLSSLTISVADRRNGKSELLPLAKA